MVGSLRGEYPDLRRKILIFPVIYQLGGNTHKTLIFSDMSSGGKKYPQDYDILVMYLVGESTRKTIIFLVMSRMGESTRKTLIFLVMYPVGESTHKTIIF